MQQWDDLTFSQKVTIFFRQSCDRQNIKRWPVIKAWLFIFSAPTTLLLVGLLMMSWVSSQSISPLFESIVHGDINSLSYYVNVEGFDINSPIPGDSERRYPIHVAALGVQLDTVDWLLARGARLDVVDGSGWTPLHFATFVDSPQLTQRFLRQSVPLLADSEGRTALHVASIRRSLATAKLLLRDVDRRSQQMLLDDDTAESRAAHRQKMLDSLVSKLDGDGLTACSSCFIPSSLTSCSRLPDSPFRCWRCETRSPCTPWFAQAPR